MDSTGVFVLCAVVRSTGLARTGHRSRGLSSGPASPQDLTEIVIVDGHGGLGCQLVAEAWGCVFTDSEQ